MTSPSEANDNERAGLNRRTVLAALAALVAQPAAAVAAPEDWTIAIQIAAGTRVSDPTVLRLAVKAIETEFGTNTVERLLDAVLARDAASIVEPFAESAVESAARRLVEIVYTGEISPGSALGFHQALAWQVLSFTKPPSICGPGFGWWTNRPDDG